MNHLLFLVAGMSVCQSALAADTRIYIRDHDYNNDSVISRGKEFNSFALALNPSLAKDLVNPDGTIPHDIKARLERLEQESVEDIKDDLGDKETYGFAELAALFPNVTAERRLPEEAGTAPVDEPDGGEKWDWLLRATREDIGLFDNKLPDGKASPAVFSYARNYGAGESAWQAAGTLMAVKKIMDNPAAEMDGGISAIYLVPSLTFNKLDTNGNAAKEMDSLVLRLGAEAVFQGSGKLALLRANPTFATDTEFRSLVGGFDAQFEPVINSMIFGSPGSSGVFNYFLRPMVNFETGYVFDAGEKVNLIGREDSWFTRAGPQLHLDVWTDVPWLERFLLTMSYSHYEALGNGIESGGFFDSSLSFRLDDDGNITLTTKYQHGEIPFIQDSVDTLTVGFGVKF